MSGWLARALIVLSLSSSFALAGCGESHTSGEDGGAPGIDGGHLVDGGAGDDAHAPLPDAGVDDDASAPSDAGAPDDASAPVDAGAAPDASTSCTPGTIESVSCGRCGTSTRFCDTSGAWVYGACSGEGECMPGEARSTACGQCGTQTEVCTAACEWSAPSACTGEGECVPGASMRSGEGCAPGATRELVCSAACVFEPAGACEAPDTCTNPGAIERVPCGSMCGSQERFCTAARLWEYGTCEEAGECVPGTIDAVPCTRCGMQQRRCTAECAWELFGTCTDQGECSPGETTWSDVGCGPQQIRELTCDATCAYDAGPCVGAPTDLLDGLGGPTGYGEGTLALSDDGASEPIDLGAAFPNGVLVYGTTYTSVYVNNNGSISFGGAITSYTPTPFPVTERPMIAPFWGDVDTRSGMRPGTNDVHWDVDSGRFVATWHRVGYFNRHTDRLNSFQVILTDRSDVAPGAFDVEFRYAQCEWTTGDATGGSGGLGGTPAQAGFDAGNGIDSVALPGSGTSAVLDLCTTTNAGTLGLWRFQVRDGIPN